MSAPAGPFIVYRYEELNRLEEVDQVNRNTNAIFATTLLEYDLAGRKTDMTDPDMGKWYYQYDAVGNLIRQTDANGGRTCLYYDALNRLLGKHYRANDSCPTPPTYNVSYTYDAGGGTGNLGQRTGMSDASGSTAWTYDERGRLMSETKNITGAGAFLTQWSYYANDAVNEMTYPGGNSGQAGEVVAYDYNSQALLKSMHSPEMNYVPEIIYDAAGRVEEMMLGEGLNNGVISPILEKDYSYYAWATQSGRMQSSSVQSLALGSNLQTLAYTYDPNGNITQMIDARQSGSETLNYAYDSLNRLKTVTGAYEETARYDTNGRITERQMPDAAKPVLFSDDFSTQNTTAWDWSSYATAPYSPGPPGSDPMAKSIGNSNSEITGLKRTAAISTQTTIQLRFKLSQIGTNARFYFGLPPETTEPPCNPGELCEMSVPNSTLEEEGLNGWIDLTPLPPLITYHNQAGLVELNGTFSYFQMNIYGHISYTPLMNNVQADQWYTLTLHRGGTALSGPLTITVTQENDPSKTGTATQTVSDIDWHFRHTIQTGIAYLDDYKEFSEDDSNVYVYGSKPHAVTSITSGGQTIRQYTYDLNGNMTQRNEGSDTYTFTYDEENRLETGAKNGVTLASYTYDGDGKRVKVVEGVNTTYYIGDYYEWREGPTTTAVKYYYASGTRIAMRQGGTLTWLLGDHLGSATITATENGTLASEQKYTAWGQTRSGSVGTDRQYTGQISEPQLGIYFYNARFYDPYLARFIQADTIIPQPGNPQAWDRYSYTSNNPVNFTDPYGNMQACADTHDQSCNVDTLLETRRKQREERYESLEDQGRLELPLNSNGQKVTAQRTSFYTSWRRNLFIDYGWYFVERNWKIKDSAFISIIIFLEFGYLKGYRDDYYQAGLSALSNQYFGTRNMLPSANPDCNGSCALPEQLSWMMDMEVTNNPPIYTTDFALLATDAARVVSQPFGNYWHWGNANFGDTLKGDSQLILETPKDNYDFFYIYILD